MLKNGFALNVEKLKKPLISPTVRPSHVSISVTLDGCDAMPSNRRFCPSSSKGSASPIGSHIYSLSRRQKASLSASSSKRQRWKSSSSLKTMPCFILHQFGIFRVKIRKTTHSRPTNLQPFHPSEPPSEKLRAPAIIFPSAHNFVRKPSQTSRFALIQKSRQIILNHSCSAQS